MWEAITRSLGPSRWPSRKLRWARSFQLSYIDSQSRPIHVTRAVLSGKRRNASDDSEATVAQQILDYIKLAEDDDVSLCSDQPLATVQAELSIPGVVISVENGLARVSGLRHATIGSTVDVSDASGQSISQGLVLYMESKVVHVALLHTSNVPVLKGMDVTLQQEQLEIRGSLASLAGAVVDPLGRAVRFDTLEQCQEETSNDRIPVTWGTQSVPGVMARVPLCTAFETGLLAVDCLHPLAFGHRFGVFGPPNAGKTRVALDVIAHQVARAKERGELPPHFVYVCIGKSKARVYEIQAALTRTHSLEYTTIIAASDRDSLALQYLAPFTGCAVAEFFMAQGKSLNSVVVYDDLATHILAVEGLVQALKLPRVTQLSLSAHAVLMERSAQLRSATPGTQDGPSLTSLVLVTALDSLELASEFSARVVSFIDDYVCLDASLAHSRIFPPINVLAPGASVRGPPFQSATRWSFVRRLRARMNAAAHIKQHVDVARTLGLETEPEDADALEFLHLVQQFFTPRLWDDTKPSELAIDLGAMFLSMVDIAQLPRGDGGESIGFNLWDLVHNAVATLARSENADMLQQLNSHARTKTWSRDLRGNVALVLFQELDAIKQQKLKLRLTEDS